MPLPRTFPAFVLIMGATLAVWALGGAVTTTGVTGWYGALAKPPLTPSEWVFPLVWTPLYLLMGMAAFLVWRHTGWTGMKGPLGLYFIQLGLNFAWSALFFGLHLPLIALVEIVILWGLIGWTMFAFGRRSRPACLALLPYWAWVGFAMYLNAGIIWLN